MLTMMLAFAMQCEPMSKLLKTGFGTPTHEIPLPLAWHGQTTVEPPFTLTPHWKIEELGKIEIKSSPSRGSNLERWRDLLDKLSIEELAPRTALEKQRLNEIGLGAIYGFRDKVSNPHRPWHLALQRYWPDHPYIEKVLIYELVKTPSFNSRYFEAIVCSMPTIKCKGKTLELLEEQLLERYAQYLAALHEATDVPSQQDNRGLNGAFIAQSADKTTPSIPKLILRTELESDTERLLRRQKAYMDRHGKDVNYQLTGLEDLPGTNRQKDR